MHTRQQSRVLPAEADLKAIAVALGAFGQQLTKQSLSEDGEKKEKQGISISSSGAWSIMQNWEAIWSWHSSHAAAHLLCLCLQIWKQMQSLQGSRGSSQSEQAQQLSDACQKLPADLRSILTANSARDVRVCRARDGTSRVAVLVVAEPTARLSQSEVKWASMIAQKMEGCLQMQPAQS